MTNNNQVNWDEIPEDVEAVVTYEGWTPLHLKRIDGYLFVQVVGAGSYVERDKGSINGYMRKFGDQFHLRPSPTNQPTPVTPESTQVESSEVEATTTPEFDWSSVESDVEAVVVSPLGHLMVVLKECDGVLLIGNGRGIHRMYPTRRATKIDEYPVRQLQSGDGVLIRRPPATTPSSENVTCKVEFYEGELPEGMISLDVSSIQTETYTPKPPSISTILQEAQQSILKHYGVTGKVKFTVTCSE